MRWREESRSVLVFGLIHIINEVDNMIESEQDSKTEEELISPEDKANKVIFALVDMPGAFHSQKQKEARAGDGYTHDETFHAELGPASRLEPNDFSVFVGLGEGSVVDQVVHEPRHANYVNQKARNQPQFGVREKADESQKY